MDLFDLVMAPLRRAAEAITVATHGNFVNTIEISLQHDVFIGFGHAAGARGFRIGSDLIVLDHDVVTYVIRRGGR